ncbi:aspartyl protease [Jejuia pallidilutea]|uniref:Aspartyl protease n=1 Tax=Jejuia pallidilutea TaxID=504487 RepID=A0A362X093_9FLAO|nr:aspartyl protease family protein [Jejuia pallidilutea]PQV45679.1 aspartyl protease [Jejuia pallidilutea]
MKRFLCIVCLCFSCCSIVLAQDQFVLHNKSGKDKIRFKLINNLIVFPVEVNGVKLSFLFDTGVSKPIIFNILNVSDSLSVKPTETIFLRGLGAGASIAALKFKNNVLKIGDAIKINQDLYAIYNTMLDFTPKLGVPIHGIIGFDILKDFIVEINYSKQFLKLHHPDSFSYKDCRTCEVFNLEFHNNKPYMYAMVHNENKNLPVKLLIDTGGSDALWLFEDKEKGITSGDYYFNDFLGHGLNGSVFGKRSKVDAFSLKHFRLKNVNVAYPDQASIKFNNMMEDRNGSVSGNILKRFNIIMDYGKAKITLKRNGNFNKRFGYNKSGIILEYRGYRFVKTKNKDFEIKNRGYNASVSPNYVALNNNFEISLKPAFAVVELREGSPAETAGVQKGDVILNINGKDTHNYSLQQITKFFHAEEGKTIKLVVDRNGNKRTFSFKLSNPLNKKT